MKKKIKTQLWAFNIIESYEYGPSQAHTGTSELDSKLPIQDCELPMLGNFY